MSTNSQTISVPSIIIIVISVVNFIPGVIGLIFNVLVFTRPTLRHGPCSIYFLSATFLNLYIICVVLPDRILSNGFNITLANQNRGICKFENFTFNAARSTSCWLIALACIDRFLHSSSNIRIRRLSSVKTARVATVATVIMIFLAYSHTLIFIDVLYSTNASGKIVSVCTTLSTTYGNFNAIFHMVFYSLCPSFLMILFGSLTINNVRRRRQVLSLANENNPVGRRTDSQLLRMLAAQVLVIIIFTLPYSILRLYVIFTQYLPISTLQYTQEILASSVIVTIPYFAHASSFYLYTLTGTIYRKEFLKIIACCLPRNQNLARITHLRTNPTPILQATRSINTTQK